jgi:type IV pilus assembly protein PilM
MARQAIGVDVGASGARLVAGTVKGTSFVLSDFRSIPVGGGDAGIAGGWSGLAGLGRVGRARVGVSGKDVNLRYTRVPRLPDWQLKRFMRFEVDEIGEQSGAEVASDYNLLPEMPEVEGEDVVLLAMARESLLAEHLEAMQRAGASLDAFTPNAVALYDAWLRYGVVLDDTVLVANVGAEQIDVVLARGHDLVFARSLAGGSRLFDQAIAERLSLAPAKAEQLKRELVTLDPGARALEGLADKASRACLGPAGQIASLLQSTVAFAKSQVKVSGLKLDRVALCGGGARLAGLERYLSQALAAKVERFDPFAVVDATRLPAEAAAELERDKSAAVVALGLATMASDAESYQIGILPERLRRRRAFWSEDAWLIAGGALLAAVLAWTAWRGRQTLGALERDIAQLELDSKRLRSADSKTRSLLEENARLAEYASELGQVAGAGRQLARVLDALAARMPEDLWVTRLVAGDRVDAELGSLPKDERPIVHVEGAAREGTEGAAGVFQRLADGLRADFPAARHKQALAPGGLAFQLDLTELAAAAEASEPNDEGASSAAEGG